MKTIEYKNLTKVQRDTLDEALKVLENSYNPYSHFSVGACLVTADGQLISGTNVENSAYGSTICAERSAVMRANAMGVRKFTGIAIIGKGENFDTTDVTGPCGSCRQVLYEMSQVSGCDLEIILSTTKKDKIVVTTISKLLPFAFGPLDMGIDIKKFQK